MKCHNRFLSNSFLRVRKQFNNERQNGRDSLVVDKSTNGVKCSTNDKIVIRLKVLLDSVNNENDKIMIVVQEKSNGKITGAFGKQVIIMSHFNGVNVTERSIVTKHLNVEKAYNVLFHLPFWDIRLRNSSFKGFDFADYDSIFFCFRSSFSD
ncbi:hypothetical protein KIW84_043250 [Lathyrus oleraceus]|uniref:Uncharacterized protein n=1 Tax=Pisum sativum TaxID=3888 RepID=A0A9D5AU77_PEA|nr:hypothetical protein KIW84_043250 [Pisum sativum]